MAKVTIEFDTVEDREELARALKAGSAYAALWDITQKLREVARYSESEQSVKHAEEWQKKVWEIIEEHGINFDEEYS